jgi:Ca2+/Na+ antiporter
MSNPSTTPANPTNEPGEVTIFRRTAAVSGGVVLFYVLLILLMLYVYYRGSASIFSNLLAPAIVLILLVYLARYGSTRYRIDDRYLYAWRLFGSRRVRLSAIRRIQRTNLRELGAVGFFGTWGWRGRVWSPLVGTFDTIHTVSDGLLVTGAKVPVFISPRAPDDFQRELARRVRSVNGDVMPELGRFSDAPSD